MEEGWPASLAGTNLLALRDVTLDIRRERELVGDKVGIPIVPPNVRFAALLPVRNERYVNDYGDLRWKAARFLQNRGAVADVDLLRVSNRSESEITLSVCDPEFTRAHDALQLEAAQRLINGDSTMMPTFETTTVCQPADSLPTTLTLQWLLTNVPVKFWISAAAVLIAAFALGVRLSNVPLVRTLFGLPTQPAATEQPRKPTKDSGLSPGRSGREGATPGVFRTA